MAKLPIYLVCPRCHKEYDLQLSVKEGEPPELEEARLKFYCTNPDCKSKKIKIEATVKKDGKVTVSER